MFGTLGGPEILLILVIALIVFGPRKLPEIGKSIGKMLVEFRKASTDFKRTIEEEVEAEKVRDADNARAATAALPPPAAGDAPVTPPPSEPAADTSPAASAEPPEGTVAHQPVEPK